MRTSEEVRSEVGACEEGEGGNVIFIFVIRSINPD